MKYLRHFGLASSLVIGGVLAGMMAPLPSEARTTLVTISVDASSVTASGWSGGSAITTATIPFDYVTGSGIANGVTCPAGDATNYNICYKITTFGEIVGVAAANNTLYGPTNTDATKSRQFKIMNAVGTDLVTQDARLLIQDCNGGGCLEKMVLTGLKIVPSSTTWDASRVKVTITFQNTFDFLPNDTTDGTAASSYRFGLSIVGVFKDTAVPSTCTLQSTLGCPVNDEMHMYGTGLFCTATAGTSDCPTGTTGPKAIDSSAPPVGGGGNAANADRATCTTADVPLCRMYMKVANTATGDVRLDKAHAGFDFPGFRCNNGLSSTTTFNPFTNTSGSVSGKKCTADITETIVFTLYGPDTVNLDGSPRGIGGNCGTPHAPPCDCTGSQKGNKQCLDAIIAGYVDGAVAAEKKVQVNIPDAIFCDPSICNGTINNTIDVTPNPSTTLSFPFTAIGPDVDQFSVPTSTNTTAPFINAFTGPGGTDRILAPDYLNLWRTSDQNQPYYAVDQIQVTRPDGGSVGPPFIEVLSCPNGDKGPLIIHDLEGTYNVRWHVHKSTQPGALCQ